MFVYLILFIILKYFLKFKELDIQHVLIYSTLFVFFLFFAETNLTLKKWNNKIDSLLLNNLILQNFLVVSLKYESLCNSNHLLVGSISRFAIMPLTYFFIKGLAILYLNIMPTSPLEFLELFLVFWVVLYIRLRGRYLNYIYLQVDGPELYWSELLEKLQQTQEFSITNKLVKNPCFQLFSLSYRSYIQWKTDVQVAYQTRGMKSAATTAIKEAARILKDNSGQVTKLAIGVVGVGGACVVAKIQTEGGVEVAKIQAKGARDVALINLETAQLQYATALAQQGQGRTQSDPPLVGAGKPILSESEVNELYLKMDKNVKEAFDKAATKAPKDPPTNLSYNGDSSLDFLDVFFI